MTAGIPSDMRRTALVSLVAHVAALVALTTVPLTKIPPRGASTIEVLLVSPSAPAQVEKISLKDGKILARWGKQGLGPGQFDWVHGIVVDSKGAVYAADTYGQRIQKFAPSGSASTAASK